MATRKRNEYLEVDDSEEELENGYDSEAQEESRGALAARSIKRRKVDQESDEDEAFSDDDDEGLDRDPTTRQKSKDAIVQQTNDESDEEEEDENDNHESEALAQDIQAHASTLSDLDDPTAKISSSKPVKPLTAKQLERSVQAAKKTGVIYLSRIPPFMKPSTLKTLLSPFGSIGRLFLTPEDSSTHTRRVKHGGNRKKSYVDGWVEFLSKKDAKMVANVLNGNIVGGKKGSYYHDDVWNIRYLKGFKWSHLTEQISNENAERAARLRAEIARERKENREFVRDVERGKMIEGIRRTRAARESDARADAGLGGGDEVMIEKPARKEKARLEDRARTFKQNTAQSRKEREQDRSADQPESTKRVLSKLF